MYKKLLTLILSLALAVSLFGCNVSPKYSHAELVIPLPDSFSEIESEDFDAAYTDGDVAVAILRISFAAGIYEGIPETFDEEEFGRFWLQKCNRAASMERRDGVSCCEYFEFQDGIEYYYFAAFYRSMNAYFVLLFAAESGSEELYKADFLSYARGVYFLDA